MSALRRVSWLLLVASGALGFSCQRARRPVPTYSEQVAPILERRCLPCHGNAAGSANVSPALTTAEEATRVAAQVALAVERRRMPPWGADATGSCGRFADTAWLDDREILTLRAWAAGGAPLGPPRGTALAPPAGVQSPLAWLLEPAPGERRLSLTTRFTPGLGSDATRCFRSDVLLEGEWALGALAVTAQPPLAVQQLQLYALTGPGGLEDIQRLEAEDAEPGWACYADSRVENSEFVASWSWVQPLQRLPAGSRLRLRPELPLVLQLRYNLLGAGLSPRPVHASAELVLRPSEQPGARLWPVWAPDLRLAAGQRRVEASRVLPLDDRLQLLGVVPQMHGLGRTLVLEWERAGQRSCLASFAHWNPSQQQLFRYTHPLELEPGDRIRLSCSFDTSSRTQDVLGGQAIDEEECRAYLYVAERR